MGLLRLAETSGQAVRRGWNLNGDLNVHKTRSCDSGGRTFQAEGLAHAEAPEV